MGNHGTCRNHRVGFEWVAQMQTNQHQSDEIQIFLWVLLDFLRSEEHEGNEN